MMASPFLASSAPTICGEFVFWMLADSPIFAAIAWAMSMSKPTACWLDGSIDSCGGYVVSERKVSVPARTSVVGGVMVGGVGLAMASADGVVFTTPGPGGVQAPSVMARQALSARRPVDAVLRSRSPRPSRVIVLN